MKTIGIELSTVQVGEFIRALTERLAMNLSSVTGNRFKVVIMSSGSGQASIKIIDQTAGTTSTQRLILSSKGAIPVFRQDSAGAIASPQVSATLSNVLRATIKDIWPTYVRKMIRVSASGT